MNTTQSLFEGVIVMFAIILLSIFLKKISVLKKENSTIFSKLVLQITLPSVIFSSLALKTFNQEYLEMALLMAVVEVAIMVLAWLIANLLKLNRGEKGALILVSSFGMTTMLGYPIIRQLFPGNVIAMQEAVITSEFGVGLLLFILGPLIAMYYGDSSVKAKVIFQSVKRFFTSPIFISLISGILISFLPMDKSSQIFTTFLRIFQLIGNANLFLVAITIGLLIEFKQLKNIYLFMGITVLLKLILKPILAIWFSEAIEITEMMKEIVLIETALPSAILTAVFAKQYNCRPDLVSMAIMVTLVLSLASVSLIFILFI